MLLLQLDAVEEFIPDNGAEQRVWRISKHFMCPLNEAVVHGIPNDRPLENGDVISLDAVC